MDKLIILSESDIRAIGEVVAERLSKHLEKILCEKPLLVEKPMSRDELARHLGYSPAHIDKLMRSGIIRAYRFYDGADPRYFASEVIEVLRKR